MIEVLSINNNKEVMYYITCTQTKVSEGFSADLKKLELSFIRKLIKEKENNFVSPTPHQDTLSKIRLNCDLVQSCTLRELMLKQVEEFL